MRFDSSMGTYTCWAEVGDDRHAFCTCMGRLFSELCICPLEPSGVTVDNFLQGKESHMAGPLRTQQV